MAQTICVAGKNNIAVDTLSYLRQRYPDNQYLAIPNRTDDGESSFNKSLRFFANEWNIEVVELARVQDCENVLFLSLEFDRIINVDKFKSRRLYNIHFSLLPEYKGMYTSALPILHGRKTTGVTLHEIDNGIDTGDVVDQTEFAIDDKDTCRDLYFKYIMHGTELVVKNLSKLLAGNVEAQPQAKAGSTYYSKEAIDYGSLKIDLNVTAFQLVNQLRAFSFREYQLPQIGNKRVGRWVTLDSRSRKRAGTVLRECFNYIELATIDYDVRVYYDSYEGLWSACKDGDIVRLRQLLPFIEDVEVRNRRGWTGLIIASFHGSLQCMSALIKHGAGVNTPNYNDTTPLMYAKSCVLRNGDYRPFELLLKNGADPTLQDVYGKTVLDWAADDGEEIYRGIRMRIEK